MRARVCKKTLFTHDTWQSEEIFRTGRLLDWSPARDMRNHNNGRLQSGGGMIELSLWYSKLDQNIGQKRNHTTRECLRNSENKSANDENYTLCLPPHTHKHTPV